MSILKAIGGFASAAIRTTVALPVAATKDVVTCFGAVDGSGSSILRQAKKIGDDFEGACEELSED